MPRRVNETEATPRSVLPGKFLSANGFAGNGVVVIIGYEAAIFIAMRTDDYPLTRAAPANRSTRFLLRS
jgi:hypothetical protein